MTTVAQARGALVHRAVLAFGGKPMQRARLLKELPGEAEWVAARISEALKAGDDRLGYSLIDSGGPYWSALFDDVMRMAPQRFGRLLDGYVEQCVDTAEAIRSRADDDGWLAAMTEVIDPTVWVRGQRPRRLDLLATRDEGRGPLVVDLKVTSGRLPTAGEALACAQDVAKHYRAWGRRIRQASVATLHVTADGDHRWSPEVALRPRSRRSTRD